MSSGQVRIGWINYLCVCIGQGEWRKIIKFLAYYKYRIWLTGIPLLNAPWKKVFKKQNNLTVTEQWTKS